VVEDVELFGEHTVGKLSGELKAASGGVDSSLTKIADGQALSVDLQGIVG
jgi:hypothetical protein